jgi:hypothetical protein
MADIVLIKQGLERIRDEFSQLGFRFEEWPRHS